MEDVLASTVLSIPPKFDITPLPKQQLAAIVKPKANAPIFLLFFINNLPPILFIVIFLTNSSAIIPKMGQNK